MALFRLNLSASSPSHEDTPLGVASSPSPGPCLPPPSLLASSRSQPPSSATSLSACVFLPRRSLSCLLLSRSCSLPRPRVSSFKLAPALFQTTLSSGPPVTPMVPLQVWEERFPPGAAAEAAPIVQVVFEPAPPLAECQECGGGPAALAELCVTLPIFYCSGGFLPLSAPKPFSVSQAPS